MQEQVKQVIADEIAPMLASHGGSVELVDVTADGTVKVRLQGACAGCPGARATLRGVVEQALKAKLPQVKEVVAAE
ncbi:MAG TPA: NifU family protein [bacterium]|nr:NifU family protein [bacterium]